MTAALESDRRRQLLHSYCPLGKFCNTICRPCAVAGAGACDRAGAGTDADAGIGAGTGWGVDGAGAGSDDSARADDGNVIGKVLFLMLTLSVFVVFTNGVPSSKVPLSN